jgi:mono/diheme cytochrome c family protein
MHRSHRPECPRFQRAGAARVALLAFLVLPLASSWSAAQTPAAEDELKAQRMLAELGQELFQQYCASCHGSAARGDGPAAPALSKPPADLTRIAARRSGRFPEGEIAAFIDGRFELDAHGTREMPIWGRQLAQPISDSAAGEEVARGRIQILVEYLKTIQVRAPQP